MYLCTYGPEGLIHPLSIGSDSLLSPTLNFHRPKGNFRWTISVKTHFRKRLESGSVSAGSYRSVCCWVSGWSDFSRCQCRVRTLWWTAEREVERRFQDLQLPPEGGWAARWARGAAVRATRTSSGETEEKQVPEQGGERVVTNWV